MASAAIATVGAWCVAAMGLPEVRLWEGVLAGSAGSACRPVVCCGEAATVGATIGAEMATGMAADAPTCFG